MGEPLEPYDLPSWRADSDGGDVMEEDHMAPRRMGPEVHENLSWGDPSEGPAQPSATSEDSELDVELVAKVHFIKGAMIVSAKAWVKERRVIEDRYLDEHIQSLKSMRTEFVKRRLAIMAKEEGENHMETVNFLRRQRQLAWEREVIRRMDNEEERWDRECQRAARNIMDQYMWRRKRVGLDLTLQKMTELLEKWDNERDSMLNDEDMSWESIWGEYVKMRTERMDEWKKARAETKTLKRKRRLEDVFSDE